MDLVTVESSSQSASDFSEEEEEHDNNPNELDNGAPVHSHSSPNIPEGETSVKKSHLKMEKPTTPATMVFPMARVKRLIKKEEEIRINLEAAFLINKATERFLEQFLEDSLDYVQGENRDVIAYKQLSSTVANQKRYEFLADFVPQKVRAADALSEKASVDN